eukprot:3465563-Amphidinium_carterae.2
MVPNASVLASCNTIEDCGLRFLDKHLFNCRLHNILLLVLQIRKIIVGCWNVSNRAVGMFVFDRGLVEEDKHSTSVAG